MNLNELINKLKLVRCIAGDGQILNEAATMLRILDGQLAFRIDAVTKYQAKVEKQQAEIEALKSHPVNELAEDLEGAKLVILRLNEMLRQQQAEIYERRLEDKERILACKEELLGAIARGFCSKNNSNKEMDANLVFAIAEEIKKCLKI
jgi:Txe/YoeB family toxin of Txe-Axe toxin-antitoxin module